MQTLKSQQKSFPSFQYLFRARYIVKLLGLITFKFVLVYCFENLEHNLDKSYPIIPNYMMKNWHRVFKLMRNYVFSLCLSVVQIKKKQKKDLSGRCQVF